MGHFWVRRGPEMIVSHRPLTSLNMSPYRAIWTHFRPIFIFFIHLIPNIRRHPGQQKLFLLGGCRPPDPLQLFLGGFQPPRPPGGGLAAPRAPLHTERLRLSGSPFFLGTKIIGPARTLATKISEFRPARILASKISEF